MMDHDIRKCPTCGSEIGTPASACPACKTPLPEPVGDEETRNAPPSSRRLLAEGRSDSAMPSYLPGHRILKEIGRGGMGVVYLAREEGWGREVAVKVAHEGLENKQAQRFVEEAVLTARLQHPAIVPIYRMGETPEGRSFYSMKRVQGQTLSQIVTMLRENSPKTLEAFGLRRRAAILLAACEGVAYAHDRGVIHRDLKPSNIMIGEYGEVCILDWGIAKELFGMRRPDALPDLDGLAAESDPDAEGTRTSQRRRVSGTPAYMSPEQARGETRAVDRRSDVWSLGAILYQLLTLFPPVGGGSPNEILQNVAEGKVIAPDEFTAGRHAPKELLDIAMKALRLDPSERYPDARAMSQDLTAYLDGRGRWRLAYEWLAGEGKLPAADWIQSLGEWKQDAGGLYVAARKSKGAVLLSAARFVGDVRIEIAGSCDPAGRDPGELSVMLGAPDPQPGLNETDGYCLQFAADWNTSAKIVKNDIDVAVCEASAQPNRRYQIAGERVGNRLALEADGRELVRFTDLFPLDGHRVGVYGWGRDTRIDSIRIYRRGLDAVVSCMAVPDHDYNHARFAEALAGYLRISDELTGRDEGWMARFKAGLARLKLHDVQGAESEFAKLDGTRGEALAHLGRSLLSAHDGDHRRELLRLSAARRAGEGSNMQCFVLARLWERAEELHNAFQAETAVAFYKEALAADPSGGKRADEAIHRICRNHLHLGHMDEVLRTIGRLERNVAAHEEALKDLYGSVIGEFSDAARWKEALEYCSRFGAFRRQAYFAFFQGARVLGAQGQWDAAEEILAKGLEATSDPEGLAMLRLEHGRILRERGRVPEALDVLSEDLVTFSRRAMDSGMEERALALAQAGQIGKALAWLGKRLKSEEFRHRMGLVLQVGRMMRLRRDLDRAQECFKQVLANLPRHTPNYGLDAHLELSLALLEKGDEPGGRAALQHVLGHPLACAQSTIARSLLAWRKDEPAPEPPDPGQLCGWTQRPKFFFYVGEFARVSGRLDDAARAYRRTLIEAVSPYHFYAWLAALGLQTLGKPAPKDTPDFTPLLRPRAGASKSGARKGIRNPA